jgi:hypothetical protein
MNRLKELLKPKNLFRLAMLAVLIFIAFQLNQISNRIGTPLVNTKENFQPATGLNATIRQASPDIDIQGIETRLDSIDQAIGRINIGK